MSFDQSATAGETLVAGSIHSPNYAKGSSGWTINRDGSAEFQNVLVRGTITGSTIIGSTIIGGTISGGIFKSANFDNTAHTGFEINATGSPDATATPPVPANTIQIYNNFLVGPTGGNQVVLAYSSGVSAAAFPTGLAGETLAGAIGGTSVTEGTHTVPTLELESPTMSNGSLLINVSPSTGTTATDFPATMTIGTLGETTPTGSLVRGRLIIGETNAVTADTWTVVVNNENSVISSGTTLGFPNLILGNTVTPQSRLYISVNEFLSVDGSGNVETLYLNQNNGGTVGGGVSDDGMRAFGNRNTGSATITATSPTNTLDCPITIALPPSGALLISTQATIVYPGNSKEFFQDFYINNNRPSTQVYGPSINNGIAYNGGAATSTI